jgi:hypothetical protein
MTIKHLIKCCSGLMAAIAFFWFAACENEHTVNVGNLVTVDGYVFQSRTNRVGVPDVTVVIEKGEESGSGGEIADIFLRTDQNGHYNARFSLGYVDVGGGVTDITPVYVEESMRIVMLSSEALVFDLGAGFTFQTGKTYKIWDVFLEDFTEAEQAE